MRSEDSITQKQADKLFILTTWLFDVPYVVIVNRSDCVFRCCYYCCCCWWWHSIKPWQSMRLASVTDLPAKDERIDRGALWCTSRVYHWTVRLVRVYSIHRRHPGGHYYLFISKLEKMFSCSYELVKFKFYSSFNALYSRCKASESELVSVELMKSFCMPVVIWFRSDRSEEI